MKLFLTTITCACLLVITANSSFSKPSIIPQPSEIKELDATYQLSPKSKIYYSTQAIAEAKWLQEVLTPAVGQKLRIKKGYGKGINLVIDKNLPTKFGKEGYTLNVDANGVTIKGRTTTAIFWGCQTLRQLLPAETLDGKGTKKTSWKISGVEINDIPRFSWRGMMLDSSRTFQTAEFIKKYIDWLSFHKINIFHWHLTDDQGWRLEIKAYPKLTSLGSTRGGKSLLGHTGWGKEWQPKDEKIGGFYTQKQIREIVAYAALRKVQILPEIDLPGHSRSAVVAYPEIACKGKDDSVSVQGERSNVWCASRDENYRMMEQIITEVASLFPFSYIHIGGDEVNHGPWSKCPTCNKLAKKLGLKSGANLQPYLTQKLEKMCKRVNRKLIGWNEIMGKGISKDTCIMSWIGVGPGYHAASIGHPVVMTPGPYTYFDMAQGRGERGHFWAGVVNMSKTYSFDPLLNPNLTSKQLANIHGVQACLWTEYCTERPDILKKMGLSENQALRAGAKKVPAPARFHEYQTYPRLCALAEVGWTPQGKRSLSNFLQRLGSKHLSRLQHLDIHFRVPTPTATIKNGIITINKPFPNAQIHYTTDGSEITANSAIYQTPFKCKNSSNLRMATLSPDGRFSLTMKGAMIAPIGSWSDSQISTDIKAIEFDLSDSLNRPGNWWAEMQHTRGSSCLEISKVELIENGKVVSTDNHTAIIGSGSTTAGGASNYRIPLKSYTKGNKYTLKIFSKGIGGNDSNGIIKLNFSDWHEPTIKAISNISFHKTNDASKAADWSRKSFFWTSRPARKGETITWFFAKPLPPSIIEVKTGKPNTTHDILVDGKLQISYDGKSFADFATFSYGAAKGKTSKAIKAMRVLITNTQRGKWLAVQDPFIKLRTLQPKSVTISTNMSTYGNNKPVLTTDWKRDSYFWMGRYPKKGDQFTWHFSKPLNAKSIQINTGDPKKRGRDILNHGVLQISYDGKTFHDLAKFQQGSAYCTLNKPIKAARIKVTNDQTSSWLMIQDPEIR